VWLRYFAPKKEADLGWSVRGFPWGPTPVEVRRGGPVRRSAIDRGWQLQCEDWVHRVWWQTLKTFTDWMKVWVVNDDIEVGFTSHTIEYSLGLGVAFKRGWWRVGMWEGVQVTFHRKVNGKIYFIVVHVNLRGYWPATRSQFTNLVSRNVISEKLNSRRGGCRKNVQGVETLRLFLLQTCTCLLYFEIIKCIQW